MTNIKFLLFLFTLWFFTVGCVPNSNNMENKNQKTSTKPLKEGYSIIFFTLDNYALVYINDELIYDTRSEEVLSKDGLLVDLNPHIIDNNSILKIEGYNTECTSCKINNYELVYELYRNGEGIEYVSEYSNQKQSPPGLSLTKIHVLNEL